MHISDFPNPIAHLFRSIVFPGALDAQFIFGQKRDNSALYESEDFENIFATISTSWPDSVPTDHGGGITALRLEEDDEEGDPAKVFIRLAGQIRRQMMLSIGNNSFSLTQFVSSASLRNLDLQLLTHLDLLGLWTNDVDRETWATTFGCLPRLENIKSYETTVIEPFIMSLQCERDDATKETVTWSSDHTDRAVEPPYPALTNLEFKLVNLKGLASHLRTIMEGGYRRSCPQIKLQITLCANFTKAELSCIQGIPELMSVDWDRRVSFSVGDGERFDYIRWSDFHDEEAEYLRMFVTS